MDLIQIIKDFFRIKSRSSQRDHVSNEFVSILASMLIETRQEELSCEKVFHFIDQYADLIAFGGDADTLLPLVKHHLEMCSDCHEEFEALMQILLGASAL